MLKSVFFSFAFTLVLLFGFLPFSALANVCLHPLEMAALLKGKPKSKSLKDKIKKADKAIKKLEKMKEKLEDGIDDELDELSNTLKDDVFEANAQLEKAKLEAVNAVSDYMAEKENFWDLEKYKETNIPWNKKDPDPILYFKSNGKVNENTFCSAFAKDQKNCKQILKKLKVLHQKLAEVRKIGEAQVELYESLEFEQMDREIGVSDEEDTEAEGLCFECLDELRDLDKPSFGQVLGNVLSIAAGGAMSYFGYRAGKVDMQRSNAFRIRGGYDPISSSGLSWAGASLGIPFILNGSYGLGGGNSAFGSFACGNGYANGPAAYSPFGHYNTNPMAQAGLQFGGGPFGGSPMAQAGLQFGGGPFGGSPMAQAGLQFGNPYMMPGMNLQAQYQQQQYAQYLQLQQQQMQAQVQAQQAWMQQRMAIQQDWMHRQKLIAELRQEIFKINHTIGLVASGAMSNSALGATSTGLSAGLTLGNTMAGTTEGPGTGQFTGGGPQHSPAQGTGQTTDGDLPVIEGR